jgi:sugar phosphate isomerase/epimerase
MGANTAGTPTIIFRPGGSLLILATSLNVFYDEKHTVSPEEGIDRCASAGFEGLDFNFCDYDRAALDALVVLMDAGSYARSLRVRAERLGLRFVQMHGPFACSDALHLGTASPQTELCHDSLRWASELGVDWIVFHPRTMPGPFDAQHTAELDQLNAEVFRDLLGTAEAVSVGIAVENMVDADAGRGLCRRYYGSVPEELIRLVDELAHPLLGVCWDTGHAHRQRLDQARALRAIGHRLVATHVQDNDGLSDEHLLPYFGTIDWKTVAGALRGIAYRGAFCYEAHNSIMVLPDTLRDAMLSYSVRLGQHLLDL